MQNLIKDGVAVDQDNWQIMDSELSAGVPGFALLPVAFWETHGDELVQSSLPFGAVIREDEDFTALLPYLAKLAVIAIEFARFADGRGFSQARQLRSLHQFTGELRAIGDIMPDQVTFLQRCGFNAIVCRSASERDTALAIGNIVTVRYQSDVSNEQPLFRRR